MTTPAARTKTTLKVQVSPLQYSDGPKQQAKDVNDLFEAKGADEFVIKTGTEAGPETAYFKLLHEAAQDHKHALHIVRDNWIAVDRRIIVPRSVVRGQIFVASTKEVAGPGHDSAAATMAFDHTEVGVGEINWAAVHYPTRGWREGDPNKAINRRYAEYLARWARRAGRGPGRLAFVSGDFNMPDDILDWFFGGPITSLADETGRHQNTGHGPIDGMASFDRDGRVKGKWFNVLDDREFPQFSDHFVSRGAFDIEHRTTGVMI